MTERKRQNTTVALFSSQTASWRVDYSSLSYSVEQLPAEIEQKVLQLVHRFDLQYSSMDFILTPTGEYIFIEMNPNCQFLWMEPSTGLPMASAMADLLASHLKRNNSLCFSQRSADIYDYRSSVNAMLDV